MAPIDLRTQVLAAFAVVPKPPATDIAPHRCPECDELVEGLSPFSAEAVPDSVFSKHAWDLPLLSDDAKQYYLPAWLLRAIPKDSWDASDALAKALIADHRWSPKLPYTEKQWLAIDAVLAHVSSLGDIVTIENVEQARKCIPR
jgi:hypothetical protein